MQMLIEYNDQDKSFSNNQDRNKVFPNSNSKLQVDKKFSF